ncbi:MAG: diguanylate cyclase [Vulcanimicrobiota bacterium]
MKKTDSVRILESLPDPVMVVDAARKIRYANPAAASFLGKPLGRLTGTVLPRLGQEQVRLQMFDWDGNPALLVTLTPYCTAKEMQVSRAQTRRLEEHIREMEERLDHARANVREAMAFAEEQAEEASSRLLLRLDCEELHEELRRAEAQLARARQRTNDLEAQVETAEERAYLAESEWLLAERRVRAAEERASRVEAHLAHETLQRLDDPITGLPNRALTFHLLDLLIKRAQRYRQRVALVGVSLPDASPRVLSFAAGRLAGLLRGSDVLGRIDEQTFVIILAEQSPEDHIETMLTVIKSRVQQTLQRFVVAGETIYQGLELAHCIYPEQTQLPGAMLEQLEQQLPMYCFNRYGLSFN